MHNLIIKKWKALAFLSILGMSNVMGQSELQNQLKLVWRPAASYDGVNDLNLQLIIKNTSTSNLSLKDWELWFNSMYPIVEKSAEAFRIHDKDGSLFMVSFPKEQLFAKDSIVVDYVSKYAISGVSTVPNGFYLQHRINKENYFALDNVKYEHIKKAKGVDKAFYEELFNKNERLNVVSDMQPIFPTPIKMNALEKGKKYNLTDFKIFVVPELKGVLPAFSNFANDLNKELKVQQSANKANIKILMKSTLPQEGYELMVDKNGITVYASAESGAFYAMQSIRSLIGVEMQGTTLNIPYVSVEDGPRYAYRGFMLDISRNFRDKFTIKKYLDLMSLYKLNVFHLHFSDDEGWRIEIPSLPELTIVGANRSPLFADGSAIQPAYGSGATESKGDYLTKDDFVEILKYARERHITIVPEIETPGHARAAIKSMQYRYNQYMKLGDVREAERYLLHDLEDKSVYRSVQHWSDNVINPALPSAYAFVSQVIDDLSQMYSEAGLKLKKVSIGGDEVPSGVWEGSPKVLALMKEKGFESVNEVWPYYIQKLNDICKEKGIEVAGWEEIGMVNQGKGMVQNPNLKHKENMQVDVWNNVIGFGQEDLAYRLANTGYKTVLISASNTYFDMMWSTNFEEPGLKWATYADLYHSYSLFPEDYFANIHTYYSAKEYEPNAFDSRVRLNDVGRANFLGIKGGLWAETVHSEDKLDYMVFPRFFVLAERAWSAKRAYESEGNFSHTLFDKDYSAFINRISLVELPRLADRVKFRLPAVGVKEKEGKLWLNAEYPGFEIYYTTDGSAPSLSSKKYVSGPIHLSSSKMSFAILDKDGRSGPVTVFTK